MSTSGRPDDEAGSDSHGEAFYRDVLDNLSDGVYFVDRARTITYWSRGAERLTGFTAEQVLGRRCHDRILNHCDDDGVELCGSHCPLKATMIDGQPRETRIWMHHRDGHRQPVWVRGAPLRDTEGRIVGAVETFSDDRAVAAIREQLAAAEQRSMTDPLTGIGNRRHLDTQLATRLYELARYGWPLGLLFVDLDRFKAVNDRYGHDMGDQVLTMAARTLSYCSRPSDTVARYGGEEFVLLLPHIDATGLAAAAERIRALVAQSRLYAERKPVAITVSIGGTLAGAGDTPEQLLRRADALLHQAKAAGRDRAQLDT